MIKITRNIQYLKWNISLSFSSKYKLGFAIYEMSFFLNLQNTEKLTNLNSGTNFGTEHVFTLNSKKLNKLLCNANNAPKTDIIGLCIA